MRAYRARFRGRKRTSRERSNPTSAGYPALANWWLRHPMKEGFLFGGGFR